MQTDYKILPKRNGKSDGSFKAMQPTKFFTNFYEISIDNNKSKIYQYSFALPEEIPQDSTLYSKSIYSIRRSLKDKIGYLAHSGQMIWGTIGLKVPTTFHCSFEFDEQKHSFESVVKLTKQLDLKELDQENSRNIYIQILNIDLKNSLKSLKLAEVGKKGQFFEKQIAGSQQLYQSGLEVLTGYRFTLTPLNSGLFLQVDVCSRVLQARNLLEVFNGNSPDFNRKFQGETVITKYGTYRTYKIEQIDYKKCPLSTFHHQKKGVTMSFRDYYKEMYGIRIEDTKQPLLKATKSVKKQLTKGGKQYKEIKQIVYLVPELVCATGMTDEQRENRQTMKALAPFTKLSPVERVRQCSKIISDINNVKGLVQIKNPKRLQGYCLSPPDLTYSGACIQPDNRGNIKHRGVLKQPFYFTDWVFVYSASGRKNDDQQADNAVGLLLKAGESYGVKFKEPGFITVKSQDVEEWKYQIKKDVEKNGTPQIITVFLGSIREENMYGELKRFLTNEIKCPSQFIRRRTLGNPKGAMSAASKIIIQMNVKVGSVPWQVQKRHPYFKDKSMMYGALSISKGKKGNTLAFVGTINSECTKVYSDCKVGIKDKENIPVEILEDMFIGWAKSYFLANKKTPDLIIFYREGLSIPQIRMQLPKMDIPALQNMIKKIGDKTGTKNYKPQLMIVTVNKKINSRYFAIGRESRQNPNKFIPELFNPESGSIVVEAMSSADMYDFHLAAQYVTQGTCTPTLFRVAYDTTKLPQEALINFTFQQCFNYYNWEGAVRVPACLQCADKLSKLVGQYIRQDINQSAVTKKHFFL